jgi:hypothetical protein
MSNGAPEVIEGRELRHAIVFLRTMPGASFVLAAIRSVN